MEYKNLFEFYIKDRRDKSLDPSNAFYDMFRNASPGALKYLKRLCRKELKIEDTTSMIEIAENLLRIPFAKTYDRFEKRHRQKSRKESSQKRRRSKENLRKEYHDAITTVHSLDENINLPDLFNRAEKKVNGLFGERQPKLGLQNKMRERIEKPGKINVRFNDRVNRIFLISRDILDSSRIERADNFIFQTIADLFKSLGICKGNKSNYTPRDINRIIKNW